MSNIYDQYSGMPNIYDQYSGISNIYDQYQGRIQKFFEGSNFRGGGVVGIFFLKNPSKLKKVFPKR